MKKILILSNSSAGLFIFRNELVLDLMSDHEVHISIPEKDEYYDKLSEEGCILHNISFSRRGMNPFSDVKLLCKYIKLINGIRPDTVLTYTIKPNIYGGIACQISHIPYITNITGLGTSIENEGILAEAITSLYKLGIRKANCIFFQNATNMKYMQSKGIGLGNSLLLPGSGVNLETHAYKDYPNESRGIMILAVLRIMRDKGIEEYLNAAERLAGEKIKFSLAGNYEESERSEYEPVIERLIKEKKLNYLGFVKDMDELYGSHHVVVHPSYHEGLSNVCLEAAAIGRPVLTTNVPGCRETVVDGVSGLLFEAKNSDALISAIYNIINSTQLDRENMGKMGRRHVEAYFSRNIVIQRYREII